VDTAYYRQSVNPSANRRDAARSDNNSTRSDNNSTNGRSCDAARSVDTGGTVDYRARFRRHQGNEAPN